MLINNNMKKRFFIVSIKYQTWNKEFEVRGLQQDMWKICWVFDCLNSLYVVFRWIWWFTKIKHLNLVSICVHWNLLRFCHATWKFRSKISISDLQCKIDSTLSHQHEDEMDREASTSSNEFLHSSASSTLTNYTEYIQTIY